MQSGDDTEENRNERDSLGQFKKGNKASVGRGPNRVSMKVKESIVGFLEANVDKIQSSFDKLKDREKLQFIAEILPYATPKLSAVQTDANVNHSGGITITWEEPPVQHSSDQGSIGELPSLQGGLPDNS